MTKNYLFHKTLCVLAVMLAPWAGAWAGVAYSSQEASVVWPFNNADTYATEVNVSPQGGFSVTSFDQGVCVFKSIVSTTVCPDIKFVQLGSANGEADCVTWTVKPAKGLTFTPTGIKFYIARNGTDGSEGSVNVQVRVSGGDLVSLGKITPHRNNKTQADDKFGSSSSYTVHYDCTLTAAQQAALKSADGFELVLNNGYGNTKGCMYSDVQIHGLLDGTAEDVERFALTAQASPAEGGSVSLLPAAAEYDKDSQVKVSAEKAFGYAFVNWTDDQGTVVSTQPSFTYTVARAATLTANFKALNTYELAYSVTGGANLYQVQPTPAGTMVDGKRMYEEGTTVTLTALSNPIVTFTNWGDGQNSSEISLPMDTDRTGIVANYDAVDYIAGWDFMESGNDGRPADFAAADNDAVALVLRNADGATSGWLDKSQFAAGGYEGRPAAVNWTTKGLGSYYWQTCVNASAFTDIKVITAMTYNYNAYTKQRIEWSTDGEAWQLAGALSLTGAKKWVDGTFGLPAGADNQPVLYIRIISDTDSETSGTSSNNDGVALGATYIIGTARLVNDGTAPVLLGHVPAEGSEGASINGKIVLTFDEKVKVADGVKATLGDKTLNPSVTGRTVMFEYNNLNYTTPYTFTLAGCSVADLCGNTLADDITIHFSTKTRPTVAKALYDAEVSDTEGLVKAIADAEKRTDTSRRFRIFIHDGNYRLPASATATKNGNDGNAYPDPTTYINTPNISFIGESRDGVVITNTVPSVEADNGYGPANVLEGIGNGDVMDLNKGATGTYFQDLTMKSSMGDSRGRDIVLNDKSDKTIACNICLWGYQDTYVSNNSNSRFYFEGGLLRGRTDFLCGKGDVYYNAVRLHMCAAGYLAVPSVPKQYGYIFKDCEITGDAGTDGKYTLGRPWGKGTPIALFIDTKMTVKPSAAGWNEMSGGWPARFAEYNSYTASGTSIDLRDRKKSFGDAAKDGIYDNNPVLTKAEADYHSYERVMGGDDNWDPATVAEQAPAPSDVTLTGTTLSWDDNDYALCWAVCHNGKVVAFTTAPTYTVSLEEGNWSVRAANEMGGLGQAVPAVHKDDSAIGSLGTDCPAVTGTRYYNMQGMAVSADTPGILIRIDTLSDGTTRAAKVAVK